MSSPTRDLAAWAAGLTYDDLPADVRHHARRVLLDYLAAAAIGSTSSAAGVVAGYLAESTSTGPSTVVGTSLRLAPPDAALANGTAAHGLEVDDGYTPGAYHPGAPVLAATLAVAEANGTTGEQVATAVATGFELSCRLAGAGHPATWQRGFHNTPLAGVFGAAAAAAKLLDADERAMTDTLGLAGSHAGGLFEFLGQGAEVKRLHAGKAARDGVVCAELAIRGLSGPGTVLEGSSGYFRAFADGPADEAHLLGDLGATWRMLRTYVKPYPCCRHLHGPIDAVLAMGEQQPVDPGALAGVLVETYPAAARHDLTDVDDFLDAQMSIPFAVAVTLMHGRPGLEHFEDKVRQDPDVRRLASLVEVREAADCTRDYPAMRPARVTLTADGVRREMRVDHPYGEPDNPVTDADLVAKFHALAGPVLGLQQAERVAAAVWALDDPAALFADLGTRVGR